MRNSARLHLGDLGKEKAMEIHIALKKWTPDAVVVPAGKYLNRFPGESIFLAFVWPQWNAEFPEQWELMTLTGHPHDGNYQLRLWFGEPGSIHQDYVDSMGRNLIFDIWSQDRARLERLAEYLLKEQKAGHQVQDDVDIWRIEHGAG